MPSLIFFGDGKGRFTPGPPLPSKATKSYSASLADMTKSGHLNMVLNEYVYLLELSLQNVKQAGSYHSLKVKVDKEGLTLKARLGYFAPRAAKSKDGK